MAFGLMLRRKHGVWDNPLGMIFAPGKYRQARAERKEIDERVRKAAAMLGIEPLLERRPRALSGGQRQRVAVGRAIVREPKAYLFDEPLSNLDAKLRIEMRAEIKRLHRNVNTTTIYVTHDQEEAMTLGDRVVVMRDGIIHQCATPFEVYEHPVDRFVAGFLGTPPMNFLEGRLVGSKGKLVFDEGDHQLPLCAAHQQRVAEYADRPVTLGIRPEAMTIAAGDAPAALAVHIDVVEPLGDRMDVFTSTPRHGHLVCRIDARTKIKENEPARIAIDMDRVHIFEPGATGKNISLAEEN